MTFILNTLPPSSEFKPRKGIESRYSIAALGGNKVDADRNFIKHLLERGVLESLDSFGGFAAFEKIESINIGGYITFYFYLGKNDIFHQCMPTIEDKYLFEYIQYLRDKKIDDILN
jgi:hypothetical protein